MPRSFLLALLALPLALQAQSPINLQQRRVPLATGAVPVDAISLFDGNGRTPLLLVAAQGTNTIYELLLNPATQVYGYSLRQFPAQQPLSMVPLQLVPSMPNPIPDFAVLTADGSVTPWRNFTGTGGYTNEPPVPMLSGFPCSPTDRLVVGKYLPGAGMDLAFWSNSPQPVIACAQNLGTGGGFRALPPLFVSTLPTPYPTVLATADLDLNPDGLEEAMGAAPNAPNSPPVTVRGQGVNFWPRRSTANPNAVWNSVPVTSAAPTVTPCTSLALGDVDLDGTQDYAAGGSQAVVRLGRSSPSTRGYVFPSPAQTYPLGSTTTVRDMLLADLTGDQRPEMLVLGDDATLQVFENTTPAGSAYFNPVPTIYFTGADPARIRAWDLDLDGDLDIVIPCRGDNALTVFWNGNRTPAATSAPAATAVLDVFPNPGASALRLRWPGRRPGPLAATLLDLTGRPVQTWPALAPAAALDVADLPRGSYLLRVSDGDDTATRRVVLQ